MVPAHSPCVFSFSKAKRVPPPPLPLLPLLQVLLDETRQLNEV
jgi:hypothetical protein